jgi:hypothetical protein
MTVIHVDFRRQKRMRSDNLLWLMLLAASACVWVAVPWALWFWGRR